MNAMPRWDILDGQRLLRAGGGRRTRLIAEESRRALGWFYLSFAAEDGFLGAIIVWAHGILTAVERASDLGMNPGGDVLCCPIPRQPDSSRRFSWASPWLIAWALTSRRGARSSRPSYS